MQYLRFLYHLVCSSRHRTLSIKNVGALSRLAGQMREKEGSVCYIPLFLLLSLLPSISLLVRNLSRPSGFSVCVCVSVSVSVSMSSSTVFALSAPALLVSVLHREPFSFVFPQKICERGSKTRLLQSTLPPQPPSRFLLLLLLAGFRAQYKQACFLVSDR